MSGKQNKYAVVVLGAGRTGTSLLMQILSKFGMSVSDEMIDASEQNVMGPYEDSHIFRIHSQFLEALKVNQYIPLPESWMDNINIRRSKNKLAQILEHECSTANTIWGFKDPRTILFLPLWIQVFNQLKIVPYYILAVRNPAAAVLSLKKNYNRGKNISELFWLHKNCAALEYTGGNCFIVHYEDWFVRPGELARGLLNYTGLKSHFSGDAEEVLKDVIKPNLNRSVYDNYQVKNEYVLKLYDVLKDCWGDEFGRERLMEEVKECRMAMDGFKGWYMEAQKYIRQAQARKTLGTEQDHREEMEANLEEEVAGGQKNQVELDSVVKKMEETLTQTQAKTDAEVQELREAKDAAEERIKQVLVESEQMLQKKEERIREMEGDLHEIIVQNNEFLKQVKDLQDELHEQRIRLSAKNKTQAVSPAKNTKKSQKKVFQQKNRNNAEKYKNEVVALRNSYSFRIGQILVNTVAKPGVNTIIFPFLLIKVFFEPFFKRNRKKNKRK